MDIVRHAGDDVAPLLPYLMGRLIANDNAALVVPEDPFVLLERAGYTAFHADTLEKQNSIKRYFAPGELLCTFNDAARHENYHIVHAVRDDAEALKREDFRGKEERQDAYGTSVISIQILKRGGFISIKNRYNNSVEGCDHTFGSNPDNIINGLSVALKAHFNVDFSPDGSLLPDGFVEMNGQILKYYKEDNNIYYGDQAYAQNGRISAMDRNAGDALFGMFLFDNQSKTLKKIDPKNQDGFADDFNRAYGGNRRLCVDKHGNLTLNGAILIGTEKSRITALDLPALTSMGNYCLTNAPSLNVFDAPALAEMGRHCVCDAPSLKSFVAPKLTTMGYGCLSIARSLNVFDAPALTQMSDYCLEYAHSLKSFVAPAFTTMGNYCLWHAPSLKSFVTPALTSMGDDCFHTAPSLTRFDAPALTEMGDRCFKNARSLTSFVAPALTSMGDDCFHTAPSLTRFDAPAFAGRVRASNECVSAPAPRGVE